MSEHEKKLEQMLKDFEKANPDAGKSLRTLLGETPAFKANLLTAIEKGNLERIEPMPSGMTGIPGMYLHKDHKDDTGKVVAKENTIFLSVKDLETAAKDPKMANTMRMVLTHESEHALNKKAIVKAEDAFEGKLTAIAKGPSPHDYTKAIKGYIDDLRVREATDQIGGFNAVAAHVRKDNPKATKEQLYKLMHDASPEMAPYFDVSGTPPKETYKPKAGLDLNKDGQIPKNAKTIEAMADYFFDGRPYRQLYGARELQKAMKIEFEEQAADRKADPKYKAPEVRVNLKELELDKVVKIPAGSGITDTSPKPPPVAPPKGPITPLEALPSSTSPDPRSSRPAETMPALYLQSIDALEKLGPGAGIKGRDELGNIAAAMAYKAQTDGLSRIDAVVASTDGKGLIAVQGEPGSAQAKSSYIDKGEAAQQPIAQSLSQLQKPQGAQVLAMEMAPQQQTQAGPSR